MTLKKANQSLSQARVACRIQTNAAQAVNEPRSWGAIRREMAAHCAAGRAIATEPSSSAPDPKGA
ncbi:MAG: hypothetical protein ACRYGL_14700 [Janthinobacterium lividum]